MSRKFRFDRPSQQRVAVRQLILLLALLAPMTYGVIVLWQRVVTPTPPANQPGQRLELQLPCDLTELEYELSGTIIQLRLGLSGWSSRNHQIDIRALDIRDMPFDLTDVRGTSESGALIGPDEWKLSPEVTGGFRLWSKATERVASLEMEARIGTERKVNDTMFLRTYPLYVMARNDAPDTLQGRLVIQMNGRVLEQMTTAATSMPLTTTADAASIELSSSNPAKTPTEASRPWVVPSISADLIDLRVKRMRDPILLIAGAALGLIGSSIVEILLILATIKRSPGAPQPRHP